MTCTNPSIDYRESSIGGIFDPIIYELRILIEDHGVSAQDIADRLGPLIDTIAEDVERQRELKRRYEAREQARKQQERSTYRALHVHGTISPSARHQPAAERKFNRTPQEKKKTALD